MVITEDMLVRILTKVSTHPQGTSVVRTVLERCGNTLNKAKRYDGDHVLSM